MCNETPMTREELVIENAELKIKLANIARYIERVRNQLGPVDQSLQAIDAQARSD